MIKLPNSARAVKMWDAWSQWAGSRRSIFFDYIDPKLARNCGLSNIDIPLQNGHYSRDRYPGTNLTLEMTGKATQEELEA